MNGHHERRVRRALACLAIVSAFPPVGSWLLQSMLTQMLVQIPIVFFAAAAWGFRPREGVGAVWLRWNSQGVPGLLAATCCLAYWMTPIALDHAAADPLWDAAKLMSLAAAGWIAGISWRQAANIAKIFYLGNMVWMSITAGMLYQESKQRLCNAYLWDDQTVTGRMLVLASIGFAIGWVLRQTVMQPKLVLTSKPPRSSTESSNDRQFSRAKTSTYRRQSSDAFPPVSKNAPAQAHRPDLP
jgi:hypothetical protein